MSPRGEQERLRDILIRISRIRFSEQILITAEENNDDNMAITAFDSILYGLLVIGEAVKSIAIEVRQRNSHIPWENMTGMRDFLAHQYFRVDAQQVQATIDKPLDALGLVCIAELSE